jgi:hypothetical protein
VEKPMEDADYLQQNMGEPECTSVDGVPVEVDLEPGEAIALIESVRVIEPTRSGPPAIVQAAAVAATGFFAGAATAAVLGRRRMRQGVGVSPSPRSLSAQPLVSSQTFLVHVHTFRRP